MTKDSPTTDPAIEQDGLDGTSDERERVTAAAAGLHQRVSDLMSAALEEMQRGDNEEALQTLERLLVLDEHNSAARSLRTKIRADSFAPAAESPAAPTEHAPSLVLESDDIPMLSFDGPDEAPGLDVDEPLEDLTLATDAIPEPSGAEAPPDPVQEAAPVPEAVSSPVASESESGPRSRLRLSLPGRRVWILAAAAIVLGLGYLGWSAMSGGEESPEPVVRPRKQAGPRGRVEAPVTVPEPDTEAPVTVEPPEPQVEELIAQADAALATADYATAILILEDARKLDPEDSTIVERWEQAGKLLRIQLEKRQRWDKAVLEFDQGDYRSALAFFYRLPQEDQTDELDRYKLNGWYNLGVVALRAGEYDNAISHFTEARQLRPKDPLILEVTDLARRAARGRDADIRSRIAALEIRARDEAD